MQQKVIIKVQNYNILTFATKHQFDTDFTKTIKKKLYTSIACTLICFSISVYIYIYVFVLLVFPHFFGQSGEPSRGEGLL